MWGWASLVLIYHQQKQTFGGWRTNSRVFASHFRVSCDILYVHRGSGQARVFSMYPRRWLSSSSRAKAFPPQGRHRRFVGDSAFHTSFGRAPLLAGDTEEVESPSALSTEFDATYYLSLCSVQQSVLVDYCRLHLTSDASCCCSCCFLTLTDPLRIQPWSQDRRNQTKSNRESEMSMESIQKRTGKK